MVRLILFLVLFGLSFFSPSFILAEETPPSQPEKAEQRKQTISKEEDEREHGIAKKIQNAHNKKLAFIQRYNDRIISKVSLQGNERTQDGVLKQWYKNSEGKKLSSFDVKGVLENLYKLRILSEILIDYKPKEKDKVEINIAVEEKWTLYPVPIFYIFQGTTLGGLLIVDSNFLGYNNGATVGGIISNRGWQYIVGFASPHILHTDFFGRIRSTGGSIYTENKNYRNELLQAFQQQRYDLLYTFGYTFWNLFSIANTGGALLAAVPPESNINTEDKSIINPPRNANIFAQGVKFFFNNRVNRFYYDKGLRSTLEFKLGFDLDEHSSNFYSIESQNRYTQEAFYQHTFSVAMYWAYSNLPDVMEHRLGGNEASRTLPSLLIAADRYFNLAFLYQIPIYTFKYGTFTFLSFFEYGLFARNDEPITHYYGPGLGFRFYLKYIAIPAFGVDVAYEINAPNVEPLDRIRFSIAIGFRPTR